MFLRLFEFAATASSKFSVTFQAFSTHLVHERRGDQNHRQ